MRKCVLYLDFLLPLLLWRSDIVPGQPMNGKGALKAEISNSRKGVRNICGVVCVDPGSCNIHKSLEKCKHLILKALGKIMVERFLFVSIIVK